MFNLPRRFPQFSHRAEYARATFTGVAMVLVTAACVGAFAQSKPADLERKIDDVSQKLELLDRSSAARFEAMDKIRAAETKALEDRIELKNDLAEVRKDVVTNAQQTVNWWLAGLAIFLTIFGIAVPIIFTRELRSKVHAHLLEIEQARREIASIKDQAKANSAEIEGLVGKMRSGPILGASPDRTSAREAASISKAAEAVAESKEAELADRLFAKGVQSFQAANFSAAAAHFASVVAERPDDHVALYNWGVALGQLADAAEGVERERLRREAISKYEAALKIKPDKHEALYNWGAGLLQLAHETTGQARSELLAQAESILQQHAAAVGHPTYNLACMAAVRADAVKFVEIADALPPGELPDAAHLRTDRDLDGIRFSEVFLVWWRRRFGDLPGIH